MEYWGVKKRSPNPPAANSGPKQLGYLWGMYTHSAYIEERGKLESTREYKLRIYKTMTSLFGPAPENIMRIQQKWPNQNWTAIRKNLHEAPVPENMRGEWFKLIHGLTPTNARLHAINISPTDKCTIWKQTDTIQHRITECVEGQETWNWVCKKLAMIIRIDPKYIPADWVVRPYFYLWPPQKHRAVLWILVHMAVYRTQRSQPLTAIDIMDLTRRSRWKAYQRHNR
jgi:hypothetical protein